MVPTLVEKHLTIEKYFSQEINIFSDNQMIGGDIKGANNRHMRFGSNTSLGKGCNGYCTFKASL